MTPHPAAEARKAAVQKYPDLAVQGSTFNRRFLELYQLTVERNPDALALDDWPLVLARETAYSLVPRVASSTPQPTAAWQPSKLERDAYNQKHALYYKSGRPVQ